MSRFRAAYIVADPRSNDVGVLLTTEEQSHLPDADLLEAAKKLAEEVGAEGKIVIGTWNE